jgi:uncharacterized phosphosugar-binding protein
VTSDIATDDRPGAAADNETSASKPDDIGSREEAIGEDALAGLVLEALTVNGDSTARAAGSASLVATISTFCGWTMMEVTKPDIIICTCLLGCI